MRVEDGGRELHPIAVWALVVATEFEVSQINVGFCDFRARRVDEHDLTLALEATKVARVYGEQRHGELQSILKSSLRAQGGVACLADARLAKKRFPTRHSQLGHEIVGLIAECTQIPPDFETVVYVQKGVEVEQTWHSFHRQYRPGRLTRCDRCTHRTRGSIVLVRCGPNIYGPGLQAVENRHPIRSGVHRRLHTRQRHLQALDSPTIREDNRLRKHGAEVAGSTLDR